MTTKKEVPAGLKSKPATKPATDVDRQKVEADLHSARRGLVTRAQAEIDEVLNRIADDSGLDSQPRQQHCRRFG